MNLLLLSFGLLLIATAVTMLASEPRTWLVAIAQGIGAQALIGAAGSAAQVWWFMDGIGQRPLADRALIAVQGLPFNAAGWSARKVFETTGGDQQSLVWRLDDYLPIAAIQIALVGLLLGWRKMQEERLTDPVQALVVVLLVANTACAVTWEWWG